MSHGPIEELEAGHCRSCAKPIRWGTTPNGKRMPLDPARQFDGNVTLDRDLFDGLTITVHPRPPHHIDDRYLPHFATCPHADAWRTR